MSARILYTDVETAPALAWSYSLWQPTIGIKQIEQHPYMLGYATRWDDQGPSTCTWYDTGDEHREENLRILWDQIDEATHVVHFNGNTFDMPWIMHEFKKFGTYGGRPPSPFKGIDLMKQTRRQMRSISNKFDYLSTDLLGLEGKIQANALDLFLGMYRAAKRGDEVGYEKIRKRMARYCRQDVNLLPKFLNEMRGWLKGLDLHLYEEQVDGVTRCSNCKGTKIQWRGFYYTAVSMYPRFQCMNPKCGKWGRGTSRDLGTNTTGVQ